MYGIQKCNPLKMAISSASVTLVLHICAAVVGLSGHAKHLFYWRRRLVCFGLTSASYLSSDTRVFLFVPARMRVDPASNQWILGDAGKTVKVSKTDAWRVGNPLHIRCMIGARHPQFDPKMQPYSRVNLLKTKITN